MVLGKEEKNCVLPHFTPGTSISWLLPHQLQAALLWLWLHVYMTHGQCYYEPAVMSAQGHGTLDLKPRFVSCFFDFKNVLLSLILNNTWDEVWVVEPDHKGTTPFQDDSGMSATPQGHRTTNASRKHWLLLSNKWAMLPTCDFLSNDELTLSTVVDLVALHLDLRQRLSKSHLFP